jgi:phosphoribosyl-ATP pyrophosphohydrolase/phosphoribosyl-AMP cyclohydrolase
MKVTKQKADRIIRKLKWNSDGLLPVAVTDVTSGKLLMLAYADKKAVEKTLSTKYAYFFSRSRNSLWKKGETSGNSMKVKRVLVDCDCDSLQYVVEVQGDGLACHKGRESCFVNADGSKDDALPINALYSVISKRIDSKDSGSYTVRLAANGALARAKIMEEAEELVDALRSGKRKEMVWEACDVLYHSLAACAAKGITLAELERELARRHSKKRGKETSR